jgi:hypothetical protein
MTQAQVRHIISLLPHWNISAMCELAGISKPTMYNILKIDNYKVTDRQAERLKKVFARDSVARKYMIDNNLIQDDTSMIWD